MTDDAQPIRTGIARVVRWWLALTVALTTLSFAASGSFARADAVSWWAEVLAGSAVLILAFVLYVAGLGAAAAHTRVRVALLAAIGIAILFSFTGYVLTAVVKPQVEVWRYERLNRDLAQRFPLGPDTPPTLLRVRELKRAGASGQTDPTVPQVYQQEPNYLLLRVLQPISLALLGILNATLGVVVGYLTTGLSPPVRRRRRWTVGLAFAVVFMAPIMVGDSWVRSSPDHSALVGVGLPLLVPLIALVLGWRKLSARRPDTADASGA